MEIVIISKSNIKQQIKVDKVGNLTRTNKRVRIENKRANLEASFLHIAKVDKFKTERANEQREQRRAKRK